MSQCRWTVGVLAIAVCCGAAAASAAAAVTRLKDRHDNTPLVLNQETDYVLRNVSVTSLRDAAALTLAGRIPSIDMRNCRFGDVYAGAEGHAAALQAAGAMVSTFAATSCYFYDAENQLVSFREGSFGTVTFERCTFRTTDSFLRRIYESSPWRTTPPVIEFYNIDRLELLDNDYSNATVIIHPSVKQVLLRGDLAGVQIESPQQTLIIHLEESTPWAGGTDSEAADRRFSFETIRELVRWALRAG